LHYPWIVAPTTASEFVDYFDRFDQTSAEGLLVCNRKTAAIVGFININEIVRGPYQRGTLGYGAFKPTARQGYMYEGFALLFRFAFYELKLHRLEAEIQPENIASLNLVKKLGFQYEGLSPGLVLINEQWRDHQRWAITSEAVGP
jgi:[ribosomal protein S5]-alanine N-acetyltransferase